MMEALHKNFYAAGVEEELLREMCSAARQAGVDIPIRKIAICFDEAFQEKKACSGARQAIRLIKFPISDWKFDKVLMWLKLCNIGLADDDKWLRYFLKNLNPYANLPD